MSQVELAKLFISKRAYKASGNLIDDGQRMQCLDEVVPLYFVAEVFNMLEEGSFDEFMKTIARSVPEFMEANPDLMDMISHMASEGVQKSA